MSSVLEKNIARGRNRQMMRGLAWGGGREGEGKGKGNGKVMAGRVIQGGHRWLDNVK